MVTTQTANSPVNYDGTLTLPSDTRSDFLSQSTAVEQSRAVAEVQAAVVVAQHCPRRIDTAVKDMRESCRQKGLADRAFYKFPRGGQTVSGPSVQLARELARCWGNTQYGLIELRRDDDNHYSEMQAWAWDVQTNTRASTTFVVPHKRDTKSGPQPLVDMRDIYESNANNGARRLRETIYSILPAWYVEEAKELCLATLADGGDKPLAARIADAVKAFDLVGVRQDRLEAKVGAKAGDWTPQDLAGLRVSLASLRQGSVTAEQEFPSLRLTVDEIGGKP